MLVQNFSRVLLLSNRKDVINFLEAACGTINPLTVVTDYTKVPTVDFEIVVLDATAIIGQNTSSLQILERFSDKFICLLPFDSPYDLCCYVEKSFKYIISFPISVENFKTCFFEMQNQLLQKIQLENYVLLGNALRETEPVPKSLSGYFYGKSEKIKTVRKKIMDAACSREPVLLLGETGTGKTTAARLIHELSESKEKELVRRSLSTVVESLAESTFFGHVKGSYTSAEHEEIGLFEKADGSTLFIDELGVASLDMQAMLLTVLETGNFKKVGTEKEQHSDARLIFATNADLIRMLREGTFRSDLYFRICDYIIKFPPLRERKEDIGEMVENYISKENFIIKDDALDKLMNYSWPGNIRELHKCLRRAMWNAKEHVIGAEQIDFGDLNLLQ